MEEPRILIVDSSDELADDLRAAITSRWPHARVDIVHAAGSALRIVRERRPRLVFCSTCLVEMRAEEFVARISDFPLCCVVLTGRSIHASCPIDASSCCPCMYLEAPFAEEQVIDAVTTVLSKREGENDQTSL